MSEERTGLPPDDDDFDFLDDPDDEAGPEERDADSEFEPEPEPDEPEAPPRSRPSRRQQATLRLRDRVRERDEENRQLRQIVDRLSQSTPPPAQVIDPYRQAELERQEAERVAQMMPHEQAQYFARKTEQNLSQQMLRQNIETRDFLDQQAFQAVVATEPMAARLADQVEKDLAAARAQGLNLTRQALYERRIGMEARAQAKKNAEAQRRRGRARVEAQTTRPVGAGSTAPATARRRGGEESSAEFHARLRNVTVGDVW
jgi:hypothetical protein